MAQLYEREDMLFTLTNSYWGPLTSASVIAYPRGAIVNGTQTGVTTITVHPGNGIGTGQYFLLASSKTAVSTSRIFQVSGTPTDTSVVITGAAADFTDKAFLVNIGADPTLAYTGSTITTYTGPQSSDVTNTNATVTSDNSGTYRYYWNGTQVWELIKTSGGTVIGIRFVYGTPVALQDSAVLTLAANTITPRGSYHTVTPTGTLTTVTATAANVGQRLYLKAASGQTITINTGGNLKLTGSITLDANDVIELVYDGTNWCQVAYTSNA